MNEMQADPAYLRLLAFRHRNAGKYCAAAGATTGDEFMKNLKWTHGVWYSTSFSALGAASSARQAAAEEMSKRSVSLADKLAGAGERYSATDQNQGSDLDRQM